MEPITSNGRDDQIAIRLRSVGKLADRLKAGADSTYIVDVARAIVESCDQINDEDVPE